MLEQYKNIHVVGVAGIEGATIASYLAKHKIQATLHAFVDEKDFEKEFSRYHYSLSVSQRKNLLKKLKFAKKINFKKTYLKDIYKADLIFIPQAWYKYPFNEKLKLALQKRIPFETMTSLYLKLNPGITIGVTGSNGKTTTSSMIWHILRKLRITNYELRNTKINLVGNNRLAKQVLEKIEDMPKELILIMEISNRQLKNPLSKTPEISVITNITPNHLDEHKSFDEYVATKKRIIGKNTKVCVLNYDDEECKKFGEKITNYELRITKQKFQNLNDQNSIIFFSIKKKLKDGVWMDEKKNVFYKNTKIASLKNFKLLGQHNEQNALAAIGAVIGFRVQGSGFREKLRIKNYELPRWNNFLRKIPWGRRITKAISSFNGIKKRLEKIAEIKGISYYDDTSSTVPQATIKAIEFFKQPVALIMGGDHKEVSYGDLIKCLIKNNVRTIVLPGTIRKKIRITNYELRKDKYFECENLKEAIKLAKRITPKKGVVLISPAGEKFYTMFVKGKGIRKNVLNHD